MKSRGVSPRNFTEKTLGEIINFYFSLRQKKKKKIFRVRGVLRRNAKKELFSWADLYLNIFRGKRKYTVNAVLTFLQISIICIIPGYCC